MINNRLNKLSLILFMLMMITSLFVGTAVALTPYSGTVSMYVETGDSFELKECTIEEVKTIYGNHAVYAISSVSNLCDKSLLNSDSIFVLTNDIYFTDVRDSSVISDFIGTLIGNGYIIYNLNVQSTSTTLPTGLVGALGRGGTLNYVQLSNANLIGLDGVGGIVGSSMGGNIIGCSVIHSDISGNNLVGGINGNSLLSNIMESRVESCTITSSEGYVGGICGNFIGLITDDESDIISGCSLVNSVIASTSDISGHDVGGIVGWCSSSIIVRCDIRNSIIAGSNSVGGIVGNTGSCLTACTVIDSTIISESGHTGGLVGVNSFFTDDNPIVLTDCSVRHCLVSGDDTTCLHSIGALFGSNEAFTAYLSPGEKYDPITVNSISDRVVVDDSNNRNPVYVWNGADSVRAKDIVNPNLFFKIKDREYYSGLSSTKRYTNIGFYGIADGFGYFPAIAPVESSNSISSTQDGSSSSAMGQIPGSPVPVIGIIAGFSVVLLYCRLRK